MFTEFDNLLKQTMGLDASSIGTPAIERAVQQRMAALGLKDAAVYLERVRVAVEERQELIEAVIVPETWFFRDPEAFAALARLALNDWLLAHPTGRLRILSLPCSTGEEPYSMAMALLDAGMPAERFRIDALDISHRSLAFARRAVFGRNSFRGAALDFRDRHFVPANSSWRLSEAVIRQVEFHHGNLLDASLPVGPENYDVIFCRNLLIYFDRPTQDRAVAVLSRLLSPTGWFFVGPSETGLLLSHAFASAKVPLAFAFRPAGTIPREVWAPVTPVVRLPPARPVTPARPLPFSSVTLRTVSAVAEPPEKSEADIAAAMQLADQGRLVEAAQICETHVQAHGPSAQAYYVLGLVRDAGGNHADAATLYRKALYLDPQHHEAMGHLALLLDGQGDKAGARVMHERARRFEQKDRKTT